MRLLLMSVLCAFGMHVAAEGVATVKRVTGAVTVLREGERLPVEVGLGLREGDEIETGVDGAVGVTFSDESLLSLGPSTRYVVEDYDFDARTHEGRFTGRLERGRLGMVSGKLARQSPEAVRVRTPASVLAVRGTEFLVEVAGEAP